jgi:septal ring factor EnvC (AmiA/AmiB activator)
MFRHLLAVSTAIFLALAVPGLVAQDSDRDRTETLARQAADRLQALHGEADRLATEERTLLGDVRRLELEREIRAAELSQAREQVRTASEELASLDQQVNAITEQSRAALPDLRARIVTLYKLGRGQYARLLLSASDLRQLGQAVRIVSALADQDRLRMAQHQQRLTELNAVRARAQERQSRVQRLQAGAEKAQAAADQALQAHSAMVRDIDARRDLNAQYSSELLGAQQRLQASLAGLSSPSAAATLPIAPFKGELEWPVPGTIRLRFGAADAGRPPLRGVEIDAGNGTQVKAIHDGTVAYADAFAGYGRLVIVDHGNQTFSLYGNLGQIDVAKDVRIQRGAAVGTVGLSDTGASGLYFELRVDGRAVDPLQWLAKR